MITQEPGPGDTPATPPALRPHIRRDGFDPPAELGALLDGTGDRDDDHRGRARGEHATGRGGLAAHPLRRRPRGSRRLRSVLQRDVAGVGRRRPLRRGPSDDGAASEGRSTGNLLFIDAPQHTRLRRLLTGEFTVKRMRRLEPRITEIVDDHLEAMAVAGPAADLVEAFALPVPSLVICELLGVPYATAPSSRTAPLASSTSADLSRSAAGLRRSPAVIWASWSTVLGASPATT